MTHTIGIDIGSAFTKAVLLDHTDILTYEAKPSEGNYRLISQNVLDRLLNNSDLSIDQIDSLYSTGIGASSFPTAVEKLSDLTCHGRGIHHHFPSVRTIIDVGGLATRVFNVNAEGRMDNFVISEKCAAGSGKLLQLIARVLQIELEDIGPLSLKSRQDIEFNTGCAVFAESEAISRITEGASREDILAGIHRALAAKIVALTHRVRTDEDYSITGGGAKDTGLVRSLADKLGTDLLVAPEPQITAALGAALLARESLAPSS